MNEGFAVNVADASVLFQELEDLGGTTTPKLLRQRVGLLARLLASYTQPVASSAGGQLESGDASGLSPQARNLGRAAVKRDIDRVYTSINAVFGEIDAKEGRKLARAFRKLATVDSHAAESMIRDLGLRASTLVLQAWDDGERHRRMRNKRGRVSTGTKPVVILDPRALKAYEKEKQNMVGYSKSSWLTGAEMIQDARGIGRVPAWIRKHRAPGRGIDRTQSGDNPYIVLESTLSWIQDAFSARTNNLLFQHFANLIVKDLENAIRALKERAAARTSAAAGASLAQAA